MLLVLGERAHILVLEAVRGDLVAGARRACASLSAWISAITAGTAKVALMPIAVEHAGQRVEPAVHAVVGVGRGQVLRLDAVGPAGRAEIDHDAEAAALAAGPFDVGVEDALLVADRVALLPGHLTSGLPMMWRATSSQLGNHTPGSAFMRLISRSSMAMRSARPDTNGMHADVHVAAVAIALLEHAPPQLLDMVGIHHALGAVVAAEPGEAEEHRVVDGVVERQVEDRLRAVGCGEPVRPMVHRIFGDVEVAVLQQQLAAVVAARADRLLADGLLDRGDGLLADDRARGRAPSARDAPTCGRRSRGRSSRRRAATSG